MYLRLAELSDISSIMAIMEDGRMTQRRQGFVQWNDGYPDIAIIKNDILTRAGRLLCIGDTPVAYAALVEADAAYDLLGDVWRYDGVYAVIHRLAVSGDYQGRHCASAMLDLLETEAADREIEIMRVDTGHENKVMQHLLLKHGYIPLGKLDFIWGERLAYEKLMDCR